MGRRAKIISEITIAEIRALYHDARCPNGSRYTMAKLARLYKVSEGTIQHVLDRKGIYGNKPTETDDDAVTN